MNIYIPDEDLQPGLIHEADLGIDKMVDSLEAAYEMSCRHHHITLSNPEYFRRYVFNLIALNSARIMQLQEALNART